MGETYMTEEYRKLLGAAGYHELALGIRYGIFGDWEDGELPLPDLTEGELEERTDKFWNLLKKPQPEGMGLFEMQKRLRLSEKELYVVFLAALWWIHDGFWPLLMKMGAKGPGISLEHSRLLMEMAEKRLGESAVFDTGRMRLLALFDACTKTWLRLDGVMSAHFAFGEPAPLWWRMGTRWFCPKEKTEEVAGTRRKEFVSRLAKYLEGGRGPLFLTGETGSGRRFLIKQAAGLLDKNLLFVSLTSKLLEESGLAGIIVREALLFQGWPVIVCTGESQEEAGLLQELAYQCRMEGLPLIVIGHGGQGLSDKNGLGLLAEVPGLYGGERLRLWKIMSSHLQFASDVSMEELADRYVLLPGQIRSILDLAKKQADFMQSAVIDRRLLFSCCHRYLRQSLGGKAVQVPVRFSWEDLLLEKKQKDKLRRAENQIRFSGQVFEEWGLAEKQPYGHGVSLVFSGPPGTGKTMAAQVLAGRIGMELYRVELPAVVSKYIGETEKNLNEIFEHAKKAQVVLFFDEADVLFGKRTDVRDSNDKYSNMEAAFLLQKMESYNGVTILATNFLRNMDEAFKRRMRYLVEFPFPDRYWRMEIWKRAFPERLPLKPDIDLEFMAASFELSGAGIRNVVLEAAFLAAAEKEAVGMPQLVQAAKGELEKNGKTMAPEDFGPYAMYLDGADNSLGAV